MIKLITGFLLICIIEGTTKLPDNIKYHELVDYSTSGVNSEHNRIRRDLSPFLSLSFTAFQKLFNLKLSKNSDVFTKDVTLKSNSGFDIPYDFHSLVKGLVNDDAGSFVHGSIHDGLFEGVIDYGEETYHLGPSRKYFDSPEKHSIIYRMSDLEINETNSKCGVKDEEGKPSSIPNHGLFGHSLDEGVFKYHARQTRDTSGDPPQVKYCPLYMAADYKFYSQHSSGFAPAIISKLGTYVQEINKIYEQTIFPAFNYRVKFLIRNAYVYETPDNKYDRHDYAVAKFLDLFSTKDEKHVNPDDYCLAYMFTHRDFEDGVLGLAWVASSGRDSGGLCTRCNDKYAIKSRCLNTGIVTTKNVKEVPSLQSYLTFGHELGHNLGSPHDPKICEPGAGNGGNFLMYPHANTGHEQNNKKLSTCSKNIMGPIISIRATCFEDDPDVCGDFKKDEGEDCDCGDSIRCDADACCQKDCTFRNAAYTCSGMDGVCCNTAPGQCQPYSTLDSASRVACAQATECRSEITCQAGSFLCPTDDKQYWESKNDEQCNKGYQVCKNGLCTESLCTLVGADDCQCSEDVDKCKLCCNVQVDGEVQCMVANNTELFPSLENIINTTTVYLQPGSVCGDDMGYCDILNVCRIVDADGPIASLGNYIFNGVLYDSARNLALQYWYYVLMMGIGIICFMAAFIAVCSKTVKPPPIPRGGERMSYPVTYKNVNNNMEMRHHGHI